MKIVDFVAAFASFCGVASAAEFGIRSRDPDGHITWSNAFPVGVVTLETKSDVSSPWVPQKNHFTSNTVGGTTVPLLQDNTFVRLLAVDISTNTLRHYTNLLESYGVLETVAGRGRSSSDSSHWSNSFEGAGLPMWTCPGPTSRLGIHGETF
jgi:hypothetical protein